MAFRSGRLEAKLAVRCDVLETHASIVAPVIGVLRIPPELIK